MEAAEAKYLPGSTTYQNMRKKPITELVSKKKKKRTNKQDVGDTCNLLEELP